MYAVDVADVVETAEGDFFGVVEEVVEGFICGFGGVFV